MSDSDVVLPDDVWLLVGKAAALYGSGELAMEYIQANLTDDQRERFSAAVFDALITRRGRESRDEI